MIPDTGVCRSYVFDFHIVVQVGMLIAVPIGTFQEHSVIETHKGKK